MLSFAIMQAFYFPRRSATDKTFTGNTRFEKNKAGNFGVIANEAYLSSLLVKNTNKDGSEVQRPETE